MTTEPKNEDPVCGVVIETLEKTFGERLTVTERPERNNRRTPSVELVCKSASRSFAIEHTRLESHEGQIADGKAFVELLEPLEIELKGKLPGRFSLTVETGATFGIRKPDRDGVRERVKEWGPG